MESKEGQASHHQQLDGEALCYSFSSSASVTEADGDAPPWQPVPFATRSPGSRVFPSAVVHAECLYIFGGHDGGVYRNDLLIFSLETRAWQLDFEPSGGGPSPRDAMPPSPIGGCRLRRVRLEALLNDFHRFHFDTATWAVYLAAGTLPRGGHTAVVHGGGLVFGGCDGWNYSTTSRSPSRRRTGCPFG